MGKKSSPPPPDYTGAAQAQAAASKEAVTAQTWANRPTQNTPWGTSSWDTKTVKDPTTGQDVTHWTENISITPETQAALDSQMAIQQGRSQLAESMFPRMQNELGTAMDWSQYGDPTGLSTNPEQYRQQAIDNAMQQFESRADPRYARMEDQLRTRMANQGITQGSEAYNQAMEEFGQGREDAYRQAQMSAIGMGGAEAQRMQGMDIAGTDYANKIRQQQMTEEMQQRGFSMNEINAALTGQQVAMPQMPGFQNAGLAQTPNLLGAAQSQYDAALGASNASNAQAGQTMGTVASVAGIAAMAF